MKLSFSLRVFATYFFILVCLTWFFLDHATEKLETAFQQSSEVVLVDTATLLATSLEQHFHNSVLDTNEISHLLKQSYQRKTQAQIYSLYKNAIDLEIYITDRLGIVIYDSNDVMVGADYSRWRDVKLTLEGKYGARTSYRYPDKTNEDDEKVMVVAAPIKIDGDIVGVLSVVNPIQPLEQLLAVERLNLKTYILFSLITALIIGYLISHSFTLSISKLVNYAKTIATNQRTQQPVFLDKRFDTLATAITDMRDELDGKEYVENYIHSLTHELKTPITAVAASAELLSEGIPPTDQKHFIDNILASNHRMQLLVDRILDLTKLENLQALDNVSEFDLNKIIHQQIQQSEVLQSTVGCTVNVIDNHKINLVNGDELLIRQCVGNLLDNAIEHCSQDEVVTIVYERKNDLHQLKITNPGQLEQHVVDRAFERFFSVQYHDRSRKQTGLGLSFVRVIMSLHQGNATLDNNPEGICAEITWPVVLKI